MINSKHTLTILASLMLVAVMPMAFAAEGLTIEAEAIEGSTTITITGTTTSTSIPVAIKVVAANGNVVSIDQVTPNSDGSFTSIFETGLPTWKIDGIYTITAQQGDADIYKDTAEVEVKDGHVIPEFGTIASLVLVIAISSIVVLSAKGRLSFTPRI
ncbi:MAG: PEFG-CTERM sorting domain-containing protein [Crenarchaeota archaeon]|nr:PEFG-CTERM sorting domain-containing protein [Thermoproteota archaeon]MDA1124198.1 PEFG-CTERM sorting domain-containing protein [Thermoproteota archaeon]